jgi:plasmid maintenance system killer protein
VEPGGTQSNHKALKSQFYEGFLFVTNKINSAFTKKCIFITIKTLRGKAQNEKMDGSYSIDCNKNYILRFG